KVKAKIVALAKRVDLIRAGGAVVRYGLPILIGQPHLTLAAAGIDLVKFLKEHGKELDPEELKKLLNPVPAADEVRHSVATFRDDFAELLKDLDVDAVVVIIDDLDRCLPPTIIETLEAIKLFLFVPQTAFVIGADERLIRHAVRQRFPELPGPEAEVGRDYLEKLIQIPITIPQLSAAEIESYTSLLFAQKHLSGAKFDALLGKIATERAAEVSRPPFDLTVLRAVLADDKLAPAFQDDLDLARQIALVLAPGLSGSPRRAKRFLNAVLLRLEMAKDRGLTLRRQVLAKLLVLEYIRASFFRQLAALQAADGRPQVLADVETEARAGSAETSVSTEKGGQGKQAPPLGELSAWLADSWMASWLASDPPLSDVDLRPYFHVARPRDLRFDAAGPALSPTAEDVLAGLISTDAVVLKHATSRLPGLDAADAAALFDRITQRLLRAEKPQSDALQKRLIELATAHLDLTPSLITVFTTLTDTKVATATPMLLVPLATGKVAGSIRALLTSWGNSTVGMLARASANALKRLDT
ncbi:MAG: P-loop NTPase fold protein, partial [Thermoanaerobaculia bacterium]